MPREKSAGAIVFRRGSPYESPLSALIAKRQEDNEIYYLLLHYPSGYWGFPKGHIEGKESEEETTRREVAEETGIEDLKIIPGFKKLEKYFFRQYKEKTRKEDIKNGKTPWVFKMVTFFIAETKVKDIKISKEHIGFAWVPIDEAIKKTTFKNSKNLLKAANDFIVQRQGL